MSQVVLPTGWSTIHSHLRHNIVSSSLEILDLLKQVENSELIFKLKKLQETSSQIESRAYAKYLSSSPSPQKPKGSFYIEYKFPYDIWSSYLSFEALILLRDIFRTFSPTLQFPDSSDGQSIIRNFQYCEKMKDVEEMYRFTQVMDYLELTGDDVWMNFYLLLCFLRDEDNGSGEWIEMYLKLIPASFVNSGLFVLALLDFACNIFKGIPLASESLHSSLKDEKLKKNLENPTHFI